MPRPSKPRTSVQVRNRNMRRMRNRSIPGMPRRTSVLGKRAQRDARVWKNATRPLGKEGPARDGALSFPVSNGASGQGTIKYLTTPFQPSEGISNSNSRLAYEGRKGQAADS